ncbi:hypothetical protein MR475_06885 [bacterium]|nr:FctA domain-containing protein [Gemmiger sp.]MCI5556720.1 hypothetical protein [bacterium]MDY5783357.1 hypothetical protein [Gemmiger sp.]
MNSSTTKGARLGAVMLTAALAAGMLTAVNAEGNFMTKSITKDVNTYAPNTTINFTVTPGEGKPASGNQPVIYAGVPGGVTLDSDAFVFAPQESDISQDKVSTSNGITVDITKFSKPGIYRYIVQESTPGEPYDGLNHDSAPKTLDVYITTDKEGCLTSTLVWSDSEGCKDTGTFVNTYDTGCFTVKKTVDGNQGDRNKEFTFTLQVNGAEGEWYQVVMPNGNTGTMVSGQSFTVTLKHEQSVTVYGLSENDEYTVTEADYTDDGYRTTVSVNDGEAKETNTISGKVPKCGKTCIDFVNFKDVTPPTGLLMDTAPYAAMLVLAGLFAAFLLRRRRREQ